MSLASTQIIFNVIENLCRSCDAVFYGAVFGFVTQPFWRLLNLMVRCTERKLLLSDSSVVLQEI